MDWVKLGSGYFLDVAIACLDDAGEVMFLRGLAYCGAADSGGFIPEAMLPALGRRNQTKTAAAIVKAGKWERVDGGYRVTQWEKWQHELEVLLGKRRREADRKRRGRVRGQSADEPPDAGADAGAECRPTESKSKTTATKTVAVAADKPRRRKTGAPDGLEIDTGMRAWAAENCAGIDVDRETAKFLDHHAAKGSLMLDWKRGWMSWMHKAVDYAPRSNGNGQADLSGAMARAIAAE